MDLQLWEVVISAMAVVLSFYVLVIGFLKVPNEMYKWNAVSLMVACLTANISLIFGVIAANNISSPIFNGLVFYETKNPFLSRRKLNSFSTGNEYRSERKKKK